MDTGLPAADDPSVILERPAPSTRSRLRTLVSLIVLAVVLALAGLAIFDDRHKFAHALSQLGWGTTLLSALFGLIGVALTFFVWRNALEGFDAHIPLRPAMATFFVSQLGKYLPGSVWPVLAQMEAGRRYGIRRRTMLAGNLMSLVINLVVGATVACILLPIGSPAALHRFWWLFLALPALLPLLHPRVLPAALDRAFALLRRPPLGERLRPASTVRAAGWGLISWICLGLHIGVLCVALGHGGAGTYLTSTGAIALAVTVGILFIPAPAGAGLREVALLLALSSVLSDQQGLAVVIVSRVILVCVDLLLCAVGALIGWHYHLTGSSEPGRHASG